VFKARLNGALGGCDDATRSVDLLAADRDPITSDIAPGIAPRVHDCFPQISFLTSGQRVYRTGQAAPTVKSA
jgi:hypothetical protein